MTFTSTVTRKTATTAPEARDFLSSLLTQPARVWISRTPAATCRKPGSGWMQQLGRSVLFALKFLLGDSAVHVEPLVPNTAMVVARDGKDPSYRKDPRLIPGRGCLGPNSVHAKVPGTPKP